jgi:hypothetical protein
VRTITTCVGSDLRVGDEFTITGVYVTDRRSRWRKAWDWLCRRKPPSCKPQRFRVIQEISQHSVAVVHVAESDE